MFEGGLHFFQTQVNITTILGGGFILDILDIIFEARLNDVLVTIDDFVSEINYEAGYFNEKYYKQGFCDGVGLMKYMLTKTS